MLGAVAGQGLPMFVRSALGIAIYGMFLAIILPPAKEHRSVREVILLAVALSLCFHYLPFLQVIPSGFVVIVCAISAAIYGAFRYPVKEENP